MSANAVPQLDSFPPTDSGVRPRPATLQIRHFIPTRRAKTKTEGTNPRTDRFPKTSIPGTINYLSPKTRRISGVYAFLLCNKNRPKFDQKSVKKTKPGFPNALAASPYPPSTSNVSAPQICSTAARNSRSGRTFTGTSRMTEKSRGDSSRSRICVAPAFRSNNCCNSCARASFPSRTRIGP
jgi:hypothetical protein